MRFFKRPTLTNIVSYVLFSLSVLILLGLYLFTLQVTVLQNWTMAVPDKPIHSGDTILLTSHYKKLRAVTGSYTTYLDCISAGSYIRYQVNQAKGDHTPGVGATGAQIVIPSNIPSLPDRCHISVIITYPVYPWRTITQYAQTDDFTVLPAPPTANL